MSMTPSYSASGSGARGVQSSSLPSSMKNRRTTSSLGKMEVVAPISAPMLAMVERSRTLMVSTPGPVYS